MTNIDFKLEASPSPRSTALPVVVAPWALEGACVAALHLAPVVPGAGVAASLVSVAVVSASGVSVVAGLPAFGEAGTPVTAGPRPRTVMPAPKATLVRNPITRKQYAYQTRVNADGDGASGPYPEREPA